MLKLILVILTLIPITSVSFAAKSALKIDAFNKKNLCVEKKVITNGEECWM